MTKQLDLNMLRETNLTNQAQGKVLPDDVRDQVLVDREGHIVLAGPGTIDKEHELSVIHQGVFAAPVQHLEGKQ